MFIFKADDFSVFHSHQETSEANQMDAVIGLHVPHYLLEHIYAQKKMK